MGSVGGMARSEIWEQADDQLLWPYLRFQGAAIVLRQRACGVRPQTAAVGCTLLLSLSHSLAHPLRFLQLAGHTQDPILRYGVDGVSRLSLGTPRAPSQSPTRQFAGLPKGIGLAVRFESRHLSPFETWIQAPSGSILFSFFLMPCMYTVSFNRVQA